MNEIKEIPTHIAYYVLFVREKERNGSYWRINQMFNTMQEATKYGTYYSEFKIFEVKLPI